MSRTVTESPGPLPIAFRISAFTGSLWVPSPRAIKELRNSWPSIDPRTFHETACAEEAGRARHHHIGVAAFGIASLQRRSELLLQLDHRTSLWTDGPANSLPANLASRSVSKPQGHHSMSRKGGGRRSTSLSRDRSKGVVPGAALAIILRCGREGDGPSVLCCSGGTAWPHPTAETHCSMPTRTLR